MTSEISEPRRHRDPAIRQSQTNPPRRYGILVVDDEPAQRLLLGVALREQGFAVWLASDGRHAVDLYQRFRPDIDVVVLDVDMPVLDGPHAVAELQRLNPRICCRFMTGELGANAERKLSSISAAAIIQKPFQLPQVVQMLWDLAEQVQ